MNFDVMVTLVIGFQISCTIRTFNSPNFGVFLETFKRILDFFCEAHTVFPRMLFALKLYLPSYSVRTTVWPECLLRSPSYCIRTVFKTLRTRDSNSYRQLIIW